MKTNFENELKSKLQNFEPQGATSQWARLSNELPKVARPLWQNILIYTGAAAILATSVLLIVKPKDQVLEEPVIADTIVEPVIMDEVIIDTEPAIQPEVVEDEIIESIPEEAVNETEPAPVIIPEEKPEITKPEVTEKPEEELHMAENTDPIPRETQETSDKENGKPEAALIIATSINEGCVPFEVKFTTTADPANYEFMWHFKDGTRSTDVAPVHKYSDPGEYEPVLILTPIKDNLQRQRVIGSTIHCYGIPKAKIDFDKSGNLYTFNTIDSGDIFYEWNIDQRKFITPLTEYEFKYDGLYDVRLKMTDSHGCAKELSKEVNVIIEHNYEMPNAFTPGMGGVNSYFGPVYEDMQDLEFTMIILDKYNQVVYETEDFNAPWNGLNVRTNQESEAGVYLWKIVTKDRYGNVRTRRGQVTLLRD